MNEVNESTQSKACVQCGCSFDLSALIPFEETEICISCRDIILRTREKMIDQAIEVLNRALELDSAAINKLIKLSVTCNKELADDPTIQVGSLCDGTYYIRPFGLINGLFGVWRNGFAHIVMALNEQNEIIKFRRAKEEDLFSAK
jgi:hypothetical protein